MNNFSKTLAKTAIVGIMGTGVFALDSVTNAKDAFANCGCRKISESKLPWLLGEQPRNSKMGTLIFENKPNRTFPQAFKSCARKAIKILDEQDVPKKDQDFFCPVEGHGDLGGKHGTTVHQNGKFIGSYGNVSPYNR